ncbi:hypothetical protein BDQ17DRAFT_1433453 [Cyathus striatus]|nr:hypothetical protein BDQ17DRAFT_1433453 [Cyathus striatus]
MLEHSRIRTGGCKTLAVPFAFALTGLPERRASGSTIEYWACGWVEMVCVFEDAGTRADSTRFSLVPCLHFRILELASVPPPLPSYSFIHSPPSRPAPSFRLPRSPPSVLPF